MHVGDDIEHDVMGARQVGMKTVWFNMHSRSREGDTFADYVITDLRELLHLLTPHG
jgi:putative hydrolase of the HAD superfamily